MALDLAFGQDADAVKRVEYPLRVLRVWHWTEALRYSRLRERWTLANFKRSKQYKEYTKFYNLHMNAVQTLNSFFDIGDTAERDNAK